MSRTGHNRTLLSQESNAPMGLTGEFEFFYNEMRKYREFPVTVVIPNAAHAMQRQNAEVFNRVALEFLSKH